MHEAALVGVVQRGGDLFERGEQQLACRRIARRPRLEHPAQTAPGDERHDQERHAVDLAVVEHRADAGMLQFAQRPDLALEAHAVAALRQEAGMHDLERERRRVVGGVGGAGAVDDPHGTGADAVEQQVRTEAVRWQQRGRCLTSQPDAPQRRERLADLAGDRRIVGPQQVVDGAGAGDAGAVEALEALEHEVLDEVALAGHRQSRELGVSG